jgi:outer membrane cobalamin receptor
MRYIHAVITLILSSVLNIAVAQNIVKGRVFDNNTSEPLHGVYVMFGRNLGTISDENGLYSFRSDTGTINISFKFIGYKPVTRSVRLKNNDMVELDVGLEMELREIGQIVVSANRTEQKVAELTVSMDVIKPEYFLRSHITDAGELINKTPGIEILDGQASIRGGSGFSYGVGSRVLALIDGLPVISPDAGSIKWQFLPLENISQIEVIKGASSVLYGSSALNGVINLRTSDATNTPVTQFFAETGIFDNPHNRNWKWWHSPRLFSTVAFSHLRKIGSNDLGIGINLSSDEGYRKFNDEKLGRLSIKFRHHNEKVRGLTYGLNINSGYNAKTDFILWENASTGALIQDISTVSYLHGTFLAVDPFISYNKTGRIRHDLRMRLQSAINTFPVRKMNNADALSFYAEYQFYCTLTSFLNLTSGLSVNSSRINSNFYGDRKGLNLSGFTQLEAEPVHRLKLVAGLRAEQNSLEDQADRVVPIFRTGINWQAGSYTFLRASFGEGYRYPSIAEKYATTTLGSVKIFPNPYVLPESGWSSEAGIKQGLLFGKINGQADFSMFFSQNSDLIEYVFGTYPDPLSGIYDLGFQATNVEQSRVYGCELEFSLNRTLGNISASLSGGYTYMYPVEFNRATYKNTDTYLKYRRKHSAKLDMDISYRKFGIDLIFYARSKILNIDDVFLKEQTREQILPGFYDYWLKNNTGYFLMDGSLGYKISRMFSLSIAVKNITNREYMGRPGDIQPQRNFSLRLAASF